MKMIGTGFIGSHLLVLVLPLPLSPYFRIDDAALSLQVQLRILGRLKRARDRDSGYSSKSVLLPTGSI